MTTGLIQELVGLCVEKRIDFQSYMLINTFLIADGKDGEYLSFFMDDEVQLQATIDRIKEI